MSSAWHAQCTQVLPSTVGPAAPAMAALLAPHNPRWETPQGPQGYSSAGAPLGNGDFGALAYGPPENLSFMLGKNDLWLRSTTASHYPPVPYSELVRIYREQDHAAWARLQPSDPNWADTFFPSSLTGGGFLRLHLAEASQLRAWRQELDLYTGVCHWQWEAPGLDRMWSPKLDFRLEAFLSAPDEVLVIRLRRERLPWRSLSWLLGRERHPLLPAASVGQDGQQAWLVQELLQGDRYAVAVQQAGATPTLTLGQRTVLAEVHSDQPGTELLWFVAAATTRDAADPLALARERVARAAARGWDALHAAHTAQWRAYWGRSWVRCAEPAIERTWYLANYLSGSMLRPGKLSPGLQGPWCRENNPPWQADFHGNVNIQVLYLGQLQANHAELFEPCAALYHRMLPTCLRETRECLGLPGARLPHAGGVDGYEQTELNWLPLAVSLAPSGWIARLFWLAWELLGDRQFLAETAWPILREVAEYYRGFLELMHHDPATGRLVIGPSTYGEVHGTELKAWRDNGSYELMHLHYGLKQALAAAQELGHSDASTAAWARLLTELPEIPTDANGVWVPFPGDPPAHAGSFCYGIYPSELASAFHGPAPLQAQARATWQWYRGASRSAWCAGAPVAAAALMGDHEWATAATRESLKGSAPGDPAGITGLTASPTSGVLQADHGPGLMLALNKMLVLGVDGTLVFFPAWPTELDAAFHSLRLPGPVLAAGEQVAGQLRNLVLQPLREHELTVLNPFGRPVAGTPAAPVTVRVTRLDSGATVLTQVAAHHAPLRWRGAAGICYGLSAE